MRYKNKIRVTVLLICFVIALICYLIYGDITKVYTPLLVDIPKTDDPDFTVHFIDVGQGDAAFIDNGDRDILIDTGPGENACRLLDYLDDLGVCEIEYLFLSHPHEDHIGGADDVITHYTVNNVVMPRRSEDSACYRSMMRTIENEECELHYASAGDSFDIADVSVELYSPCEGEKVDDTNLVSLIMKLSYGELDIMFTGDAVVENERYAMGYYLDSLDCEILKVGHHGSSTSTCEKFFDAVSPEVAIISVGKDNPYGHPHHETMRLLNEKMDYIYRTDRDSHIVLASDKENYWFVGR